MMTKIEDLNQNNTKHNMSQSKILITLIAVVLVWSSAFIGIKIGLGSYSPASLALLRLLTASVFMFFVYWFLTERHLPKLKDVPYIFLLGLLGMSLYIILLSYGQQIVSAGTASFIIGTEPIQIVIISAILLKEKITRTVLIGMVFGFVGITLIFVSREQSFDFDLGILYVLLAALSASFFTVLLKKLLYQYSALELTSFVTWAATLSLIMFLPDLYQEFTKATLGATLSGIYLGVFAGGIGYLAWSYLILHTTANQAAISLYSVPVVTLCMGFLVLGEMPRPLTIVGGVISLVGAIIVNSSRKPT